MNNTGPIGIFDSGVGGLSVMRHIREQLPNEDLMYIADNAHLPYGDKSRVFVAERSKSMAEFLLGKGAKALVVACNTATAAAINQLRGRWPNVPIIGMEPGLKPAAARTTTGIIGVLATTGTLNSRKYNILNGQIDSRVRVIAQACPGLVEHVESGNFDGENTRELLQVYLSALLEKGADTIVLGCTHYPVLKPLIREIAGNGIDIIDTGSAVAREVARRLENDNLLHRRNHPGKVSFWSSDKSGNLHSALSRLWKHDKFILQNLPPEYCGLREKALLRSENRS